MAQFTKYLRRSSSKKILSQQLYSNWTDSQIEIKVSNLLFVGVTLAATIIIIGGVIYLVLNGTGIPKDHIFYGEPADLRQFPGILHDVLVLRGQGIIQLGILLLIFTPVIQWAFRSLHSGNKKIHFIQQSLSLYL